MIVTDDPIPRDMFYNGRLKNERGAVVLREDVQIISLVKLQKRRSLVWNKVKEDTLVIFMKMNALFAFKSI